VISRKVLLVMMSQGSSALLGIVSLPVIARYIPKADYGLVIFVFGLIGMLSFLADLGFSQAHVKRMTEGNDPGVCVGTFFTIKFILIGFLIAGTILLFIFWEKLLGYGYQSPATPIVARIILGHYILLQLHQMFYATFQSKKQTALQEMPVLAMNATRFGAILFVAFTGMGIFALAGTYFIAGAAGAIVASSIFLKHGVQIKKPSWEMIKSYTKFAMPLIIFTTMMTIALNTDKVMIQLFWDSVEVADYGMSQRIVTILLGLSAAVGTLLFPVISEAHAQGNMARIRKVTHSAERYLSLTILPIIVVFLAYPYEIFHIIGDQYLTAATILRIMTIYALVYVMFAIYIYQMNGLNRPGITAKVTLLVSLLNIGLNLILIPTSIFGFPLAGWGIEGAGIATTASTVIGLVIIRYYSYKFAGMKTNNRLALHFLAAVLSIEVLLLLAKISPPDRIFLLAPYALAGLGIFAGALWFMGELTKKDIDFFLSTINPKEMLSYIWKEMKHG